MTRFRSPHGWGVLALLLGIPGSAALATEYPVPTAPEQPVVSLPASAGAYAVGVRSFAWMDESRSETGRPGEDGVREITATAWYPTDAADDGQKARYFPTLENILAGADQYPAEQQRYALMYEPLSDVATNSMPGAKPATIDDGWPVILFSPGGSVSSHAQTALAERLAGNGYVFVAMSHPHSSFDFGPETGFSMSRAWDLDNKDRAIADANDNELADILAADASFVLERMRELQKTDHVLGRVMDLERVGIAGHSRGGKTVGRACSTNGEFKACVVLDNIGPARERTLGIKQPFLTLRAPWDEERVAELHDYLGRTRSVAYDLALSGSNHFSCSDLPIFIADIRSEALAPVDGINACASIIQSFLDKYLKTELVSPTDWLPAKFSADVDMTVFSTN